MATAGVQVTGAHRLTYVLNLDPERVLIGTEMAEWKQRFPQWGPGSDVTMHIVNGWRSGARKLEPDELPYTLIANKPRKAWPDMFETTGGLMVVSGAVNSIIEDHDPSLHQFFPLTLQTKRGSKIEGPWFAMNVTERRESIVMERSTIVRSEIAPDYWYNFIVYPYRNIVVDPAKQPEIHLWRESKFNDSLLASDALVGALKAAELKILPNFKAKKLRGKV